MATQNRKPPDVRLHQESRTACTAPTPAASSPSSSCSRSSSRSACRTGSSAICSCSSRWRSTPSSAWRSRTAQVSEYYVAGRRVPAFYNGMATGADWMSAASFVGMAGSLFLLGYDGLAWVLGWTGGFVLVSILVGPYLRKFGAYTVPDFMAFRYGGNFARFLAVIVLVCCSFTYVTAQIYGTGLIASRFLGMQFEIAVFAGLVGILLCAMLGGMRAVTWTQIAQYIVLIVAYLTPIVILSTKKYGIPIPELTYGQAIPEITAREQADAAGRARDLCTEACGRHAQAAHPAVHELHPAELLRHHLLHDGRHGVAAAHPDALLHHAVRA